MEVEAIALAGVGVVAELIGDSPQDAQPPALFGIAIALVVLVRQHAMEIETRPLVPDAKINGAVRDGHFNHYRCSDGQVSMGMANRIGKAFGQCYLAL